MNLPDPKSGERVRLAREPSVVRRNLHETAPGIFGEAPKTAGGAPALPGSFDATDFP